MDKPDRIEKVDKGDKASKPQQFDLELSRQRLISWTIFGIIVGSLLVWKLGTVGVWVGVLLIVLGVLRGYQLVQTFIHPAGTFVVSDTKVTLPRGLCLPRPIEAPRSQVTACYFLRRSVPWNRSAPVLVVELGERALAYPRDWFASESDQRMLQRALNPHRELHVTTDDELPADSPSSRA